MCLPGSCCHCPGIHPPGQAGDGGGDRRAVRVTMVLSRRTRVKKKAKLAGDSFALDKTIFSSSDLHHKKLRSRSHSRMKMVGMIQRKVVLKIWLVLISLICME